MNVMWWRLPWLAVLALLAVLASLVGPASARAQGVATIQIDQPVEAARVSGAVTVSGWAADLTASGGSGIDEIRLTLDGPVNAGQNLGSAAIGVAREDVAAAMGNPNLAGSGYLFTWDTTSTAPGTHALFVNAHSPLGVWSYASVNVVVEAGGPPPPPPPPSSGGPPPPPATGGPPPPPSTGGPPPPPPPPSTGGPPPPPAAPAGECATLSLFVDTPRPDSNITSGTPIQGWAVNRASTSGAGVQSVQVLLDGPPGQGAPIGNATLNVPRPDVATNLGNPAFANAGWRLTPNLGAAPPGAHTLVIVVTSSCGTASASVPIQVAGGPSGPPPPPGPPTPPPPPGPPAPPPAGTGLGQPTIGSIAHVGSHAVRLTWTPVPNALGYYIFRSAQNLPANPADPRLWELAGDIGTPAFTDSTGIAGVPYYYAVQAYGFGNTTGPLSPPAQVFVAY